jgi:hypothetical protein
MAGRVVRNESRSGRSKYDSLSTRSTQLQYLRKLDSPRELIRPSGGVRLRLTSLLADVFSFCAEAIGEFTAESDRSSSKTFSSSASASVV